MTEGFVLNQVQIDLSKMIKFLLLYYIVEINCEPLVLSGSQIVFDVNKIDEEAIDKYLENLSETQSQNSEEPKNTCKLKVSKFDTVHPPIFHTPICPQKPIYPHFFAMKM